MSTPAERNQKVSGLGWLDLPVETIAGTLPIEATAR